jgi:hypothetical protein
MDAEPKTLPILLYSSRPPSRPVRWVEAWFWGIFYIMGLPLGVLTLLSLFQTSPAALFLKAAAGLWLGAVLLHAGGQRLQYRAAGAWTVGLWIPMGCQVVRRLHYWITIGMEPPDGMGSPLAFLIGFVMEQMVFLPLTALLLLLLLRGWLLRRRSL